MIKWFMSTLLVAVIVAGIMILYLSPDLRAKARVWFKDKNALVIKRAKALKQSFLTSSTLKKIKGYMPFNKETKTKPAEEKETETQAKNPPMQDHISEKDRKELEKILEKAQTK